MARIPKHRPNSSPETKRLAVGYTRVSTAEQADEGVSLAQQREAILAYGAVKSLSFDWGGEGNDGIMVEAGVSGGLPLHKRPEGSKLSRMIHSEQIGHVVATKLDRLFRSAEDSTSQIAEMGRRGVSLHLLDLGGSAIDVSSTSGRLIVGVLAQVAEMGRGTIRDNTLAGMKHKKDHGEYCGGGVPYGYRLTKGSGGVILVEPDEVEQAMIAEACRLRAGGMTLLAVGRALFDAGHRPRNGGPWTHEAIRRMTYKAKE